MEIYDSLLGAVCDEYDRVTLIKKRERGEVTLIRHRACLLYTSSLSESETYMERENS